MDNAEYTGAFQLYDIDGDGFITYDEMLAVSVLISVHPPGDPVMSC